MSSDKIDKIISTVAAAPRDSTWRELVRLAGLDPKHDFRYARFTGVDFTSADLRDHDFTGADLDGCKFRGALIAGANFAGSNVDLDALGEAADWSAQHSKGTAVRQRIEAQSPSDLSVAELVQIAVRRGEGQLASTGALAVTTGVHTGRSPNDKFTVRDALTEGEIWWDNNREMLPEHFDTLRQDFMDSMKGKQLFEQRLIAGADPKWQLKVHVTTEFAWHSLLARNIFRHPDSATLAQFDPDLRVICLPSFKASPSRHGTRSETVIGINYVKKMVLIGGTEAGGEIKKAVFTYLNYLLPTMGVMPMHCSANVGHDGDSAVFFGLSGTGKTTLSADPRRILLGDDEHGWSNEGIFNFEGGCYAKTIRLSKMAEPAIWNASNRPGTVLENVPLTRGSMEPDFDDGRLTENTRSCYPLEFIPNASKTGTASHPENIFMLCADAFGVMPPIAKLSPSQAMYHFLSGYTSKVAGTVKGMKGNEVSATFSTCFGAPFLPRHPAVYGNLLRDLIAKHRVNCWLINTGWTGGKFGAGSRMPIKATRALLDAALSGNLADQPMRQDPVFGFLVPLSLDGVDTKILTPRETWADTAAYDAQAKALVEMFTMNFRKFEAYVEPIVMEAAPLRRATAA